MASQRSYLRVILMIAALLSTVNAAFAQFPIGEGLGALKEQVKERAFVKAATLLLNNDLPVVLDATTALPTVDTLPGGPFRPRPLAVSADMLSKPLPPGDYVVNVTAFCTEYSVHRPGKGVAYKLAPLKGHAAQAVATLLWRGMKAHVPERRLMSLTWAIQSGLSYSEMPAAFKADYDRLIPDYESDFSGDFIQELEDSYKKASQGTKLPPLDELLGKMGAVGKTVLTAKRQREALMAQGQSDEVKEQTLFAGQESGVYTPVSAEEGPWTERIPGVAYMRFKIEGGNLASDNVMEIRILGEGSPVAQTSGPARMVTASYPMGQGLGSMLTSPTLISMLGAQQNVNGDITADGMIGYSQGQGAQALIPGLGSAPCTIEAVAVATKPAKRDGIRFGVGEKVNLIAHEGVGPVQATWQIASGLGEVDKNTGLFVAPFVGGTTDVVATVSGNETCSKPLTIVEPSGLLFYTLESAGYDYKQPKPGYLFGFHPAVFIVPGDVSFANIAVKEWEPNPRDDRMNQTKNWTLVSLGDPNAVNSPHLVKTKNDGNAWFLTCDTVGTQTSVLGTQNGTSQWWFKNADPTASDALNNSRPFSLVKTTWKDVTCGLFCLFVSKGQIAVYQNGEAQPLVGPSADLLINTLNPLESKMKDLDRIENCYQDFVTKLGFTELY